MEKNMVRKTKLYSNIATQLTVRNPLHNHPLLRKGGIHKKTNKALRRKERVDTNKEWLPQNILLIVYFEEAILFITHV